MTGRERQPVLFPVRLCAPEARIYRDSSSLTLYHTFLLNWIPALGVCNIVPRIAPVERIIATLFRFSLRRLCPDLQCLNVLAYLFGGRERRLLPELGLKLNE